MTSIDNSRTSIPVSILREVVQTLGYDPVSKTSGPDWKSNHEKVFGLERTCIMHLGRNPFEWEQKLASESKYNNESLGRKVFLSLRPRLPKQMRWIHADGIVDALRFYERDESLSFRCFGSYPAGYQFSSNVDLVPRESLFRKSVQNSSTNTQLPSTGRYETDPAVEKVLSETKRFAFLFNTSPMLTSSTLRTGVYTNDDVFSQLQQQQQRNFITSRNLCINGNSKGQDLVYDKSLKRFRKIPLQSSVVNRGESIEDAKISDRLMQEEKIKENAQYRGSHWVVLYVEPLKGIIDYYDSTGNGQPNELVKKSIASVLKVIRMPPNRTNGQIEICFTHCRKQMKGSDCGVYVVHFVVQRLHGISFKEWVDTDLPDSEVSKYRNVYWTEVDDGFPL